MKRARHVNTLTSEFLPQMGPGRSAQPPASAGRSRSRPRSRRPSWIPTNPGAWIVFGAFAVFGAAVVATAYLAVQEIAERELGGQIAPFATDPSVAHTNNLPHSSDLPPRAASTPAPESGVPDRVARSAGPAEAPPAEVAPAIIESPLPAALPEKSLPRKAATEARKKPSTRMNPAHSSEVSDEAWAARVAPQSAAIVAPSPPASAPVAPVPDRWETMNTALAACSREGFLAEMMCTERVRYQYCNGFWGQVPQCRAATRPGISG